MTNDTKKYKTLWSEAGAKKLDDLVNVYIADGWLPIGGVSVAGYGNYNSVIFCQAMVRGL